MKKMIGCPKARKIKRLGNDQDFERHFAGCAECRKSRQVFDWMRKLAEQTAIPQNLPTPGFLLFKARFIEKQTAAARAVRPIIRMQIASAVLFALATGWLLLKGRPPIGWLMRETFSSLVPLAPLLFLGVVSALLICFAFTYFLRETKELKK